jgi:hypothetical protein
MRRQQRGSRNCGRQWDHGAHMRWIATGFGRPKQQNFRSVPYAHLGRSVDVVAQGGGGPPAYGAGLEQCQQLRSSGDWLSSCPRGETNPR